MKPPQTCARCGVLLLRDETRAIVGGLGVLALLFGATPVADVLGIGMLRAAASRHLCRKPVSPLRTEAVDDEEGDR